MRRTETPAGPADPADVLRRVLTILRRCHGPRRRPGRQDAVADTPLGQVRRCIQVSGLARTKAPRIQAILRGIRRRRGKIELDFLAEMGADEAFAILTAFKGIGPKTALCTLLFALGRPVFPVDTHIFRIARRLGVLAEAVPPAKAHEALTPLERHTVPYLHARLHPSLLIGCQLPKTT